MTGKKDGQRALPPSVIAMVVVAAVLIAIWTVYQNSAEELPGSGRAAEKLPYAGRAAEELPYAGRADASDAELVARGRAVYTESCASCHGASLEGQPNWRVRKADGTLPAPPHDETGHTWHHSDLLLFEMTKRGTAAVAGGEYQSDMRGFADELDDADIWAVLAYIKSQWPADVQAAQALR